MINTMLSFWKCHLFEESFWLAKKKDEALKCREVYVLKKNSSSELVLKVFSRISDLTTKNVLVNVYFIAPLFAFL